MKGKITALKKISLYIIPMLSYWLIRLIRLTMRIRYVNHERYSRFEGSGKKVILACWHGRLLMMPYCHRAKKFTGLISMHSDGELLARTLRRFDMDSVRGSTTRGSLEGIKGLLRAVKSGSDVIGITPDGPKGPARESQMGVVYMARMTGLPVVAVGFGSSKKKLLRAGIRLFSHTPSPRVSLPTPSLCM